MKSKPTKAEIILGLLRKEKDEETLIEAIRDVNLLGPTLSVINGLVDQGLIDAYAIGGGAAVLYYCEPVLTDDFDVFCHFPGRGTLIDPSPVFEYLREKGYVFESQDKIVIGGVPVQFIAPAAGGLTEEAVENALEIVVQGERTRIFAPEYLLANMIDLGRPKDRAKISIMMDEAGGATVDRKKLKKILARYKLTAKWNRFFPEFKL